jgi:hypothetical protein
MSLPLLRQPSPTRLNRLSRQSILDSNIAGPRSTVQVLLIKLREKAMIAFDLARNNHAVRESTQAIAG